MWAFPGLRVVAVVAHPDDESWALGGTLAGFAAGGAIVTVVSATDGEGAGERTVRRAELAAACEVLGAQTPVFLGWDDTRLAKLPLDPAAAALASTLEKLAPDIVVGLGPDGGYGHVDHTTLQGLLRAVVASTTSKPCLFEAKFPPALLSAARRGVKAARSDVLDPAVRQLGEAPQARDVVVPIAAFAHAKLTALACHRSQLNGADAATFLAGAVTHLLAQERFVHVCGDKPVALHVTRDLAPRVNGGISVLVRAMLDPQSPTAARVVSFDGWRPRRRDSAGLLPRPRKEGGVDVLRLEHPAHLAHARRFATEVEPSTIVVHHALLWPFASGLASANVPKLYVQHVDQAAADSIRELPQPTASAAAEQEAIAAAHSVVRPRDLIANLPSARLSLPASKPGVAATADTSSALETSPIALYVGRFSDIKGTDVWFEAIAAVAVAVPNCRFVVAGGIPDNPKSERRWVRRWQRRWGTTVSERVSFLGWVDRGELAHLHQQADVVVVPSRAETFGLVALEAMNSGALIVASDIGALRTTLTGYDRARFAAPCDPIALVAAVVMVLQSRLSKERT